MLSKLKKFLLIILVLLLLTGISFYIIPKIFPPSPFSLLKKDCPVLQQEKRLVKGNSLTPILNPGDQVKILFNYYECSKIQAGEVDNTFKVKRDDIIAYDFAGQPSEPIIKIIKAIPGDSFKLQRAGSNWNILINNKILKNSQGQPYNLPEAKYKMLHLYERDFNGLIPADTYLILGNLPSGSLDSTRFGLVHKNDILGKVVE